MGTEVAISFSALRAQLESEKSSLYKIDENIKKIVQTSGRFSNDRFNNSSGDYVKGGPRLGGRNSFTDSRQNDDSFGKRKQETKTVFSRLSARTVDSDGEEEGPGIKRVRMPSAVSRELPTRAAVLRAQGGDEQARTRNRRIFGSLLGTLQKFKQEEIVLQTKEDKKAQVERKIEEQARLLKEKELRERKTLFADREHKKATIKALEAKMARVQEFEKWEASQKHLSNFILTRAKPHIYWIPKKMTEKATEKLTSSRKYTEKYMAKKREELQDELLRIEQRCLRLRAPQAKENEPHTQLTHIKSEAPEIKQEGARKRDKFTNDIDEKEKDDSDVDDQHDAVPRQAQPMEETVTDESKLDITDTSVEPNTTTENAENTNNNSQISSDVHMVTLDSLDVSKTGWPLPEEPAQPDKDQDENQEQAENQGQAENPDQAENQGQEENQEQAENQGQAENQEETKDQETTESMEHS